MPSIDFTGFINRAGLRFLLLSILSWMSGCMLDYSLSNDPDSSDARNNSNLDSDQENPVDDSGQVAGSDTHADDRATDPEADTETDSGMNVNSDTAGTPDTDSTSNTDPGQPQPSWAAQPDYPIALGAISAATSDRVIYIMGGDTSYFGNKSSTSHRAYDPASDSYSSKARTPDDSQWRLDIGAAIGHAALKMVPWREKSPYSWG